MANVKRYFICDRYRQAIDKKYAEEFIRDNKVVFYSTEEEARKNFGFYDDSDFDVMSIDESGKIEFANGRKLI